MKWFAICGRATPVPCKQEIPRTISTMAAVDWALKDGNSTIHTTIPKEESAMNVEALRKEGSM
jgi:hypothetical protein